MNMKIFTPVFFLLTLTCNLLFGQREMTSSVPKALRAFETSRRFYDIRQNDKALEAIEEAIKADKLFIEAYTFKANILTDMKQFEKAVDAYKDAIAINPDFFPNNFYSLAKTEYLLGRYSDAKSHFEKFITFPKIKSNLSANAKQYILNCTFAEQAILNPIPFAPVNMGASINSADQEYFPAITADGKTFLFTRRLPALGPGGSPTEQEDFYISTYGKSGWDIAQPIKEINTIDNEGAASLSSDGQYLFFIGCDNDLDVRQTNGSCDIFLSKKNGNTFNKPRNLDVPINTGSWESMPSFSSDGRTLYFVRVIKDKLGVSQYDIMVTSIGENSQWSEPVSVSDKINTPMDEMYAFIHPDDQTLYFTSNGHPGMGGLDIFMSKRNPDGSWGDPINLGYPINTKDDENSLLVSPDGESAFFSSDRPGGFGGLDIYQFPLYEKMRPQPVTYMKGKVYDIETKKPLSASFELIDLATGKTVVSSTSNIGNGEFLVALPTGKSYALNVSKDGYLFYSENFELKNVKSNKDPFIKDVPMKPIKAGESMVLKNIFFDTDKFELKNESRIELKKLIGFLTKNISIKFEISGHTDNVGGKEYNQGLSERRARSVYEFLLANGIPATRMVSKGFGDTKPVADNNTDSGRAQNRRTEFMITEVK
jgi:outer membrane protein OmpA-like peptidoglycan-associated protein